MPILLHSLTITSENDQDVSDASMTAKVTDPDTPFLNPSTAENMLIDFPHMKRLAFAALGNCHECVLLGMLHKACCPCAATV
jgi:hypothetical protein